MAAKKPPFNQEMQIRGANRRLFARSPIVREKLEESRQEFPRYKKDGSRHKRNWVKRECEVCNTWVSAAHIVVDHIDPVVPPGGFDYSFNMWERISIFLQRLWCDKSNLQRICDDCHKKKTAKERFDKMLKTESNELDWALSYSKDEKKKWLKKYTKKRLAKYPYPQDFKDQVIALRRSVGMKV